ncbi:MAG: hypothetical protein JEY91_18610 [Spirochaetaceae bacterium]|nr:hypothetical protein [Spirochaetaceae bacterium]
MVQINIETDLQIISSLEEQIKHLESVIIKCTNHHDPVAYSLLQTIPGIGRILGLTILYCKIERGV